MHMKITIVTAYFWCKINTEWIVAMITGLYKHMTDGKQDLKSI
jgi:hypothetical protein